MSEKELNKETLELTLGLIKPDAFLQGNVGQILNIIELNDFTIVALELVYLSQDQAEEFYSEHRGKPFFNELVEYITSGPIIAMALAKENAINQWRELMGATDPLKAAPGTLRAMFGESIGSNAVHGSDSKESARRELDFFFPEIAEEFDNL